MYLAKNLKYLRLKFNFSQDYLAEKFGYKSYTTIQKWEMGTSEPSLEKLSILSQLYNVDMNTLYSVDLERGEQSKADAECNKIPLLGAIMAELPILAEQNIEDYFYLDSSIRADFGLRIKSDSMLGAGIFPGNIVFIKEQAELENGEIGAVLIENEATLKKFYRNNGTTVLLAENDKYQPLFYTNKSVKILGKLTAVLNIKN